MYRTAILALVGMLATAGWSQAQLPSIRMPTTRQANTGLTTTRQQATTRGFPQGAPQVLIGNTYVPFRTGNAQFQTGNPNLAPNSRVIPPQNPNLGMPALIPQGAQANTLLRGPSSNFSVNGGLQQPQAGSPLGPQALFLNGNLVRPVATPTAPLQTGNPNLSPNMRAMPMQNPNVVAPMLNPLGSQANTPLRGPG